MAEYIERDKALNVCEMHYKHCISMQDWRGDTIAWNIGADIKTIPAADVVEVKHGRWFLLDDCSNAGVYCSVCRKKVYREKYANQKLLSKYCPSCGAKMDGGNNA